MAIEFPDLNEIRTIVEEVLPDCWSVESVVLEYGDHGGTLLEEFDVHVRLNRAADSEEPYGWAYDLSKRVRSRWPPSKFRFSITFPEEPA